jgi:hypothetical protein
MSLNTHFTTWCNRGREQLLVEVGLVKGDTELLRPLLKSILCQDDINMLLYAWLLHMR